ncbi:MAG: glycosyltransferase family 39 protein, partial [Candidatus Aminicenantes bacterium]|nr:glycosyltransferase family 39 protein [Candidatus Aminicenantes bacterium]
DFSLFRILGVSRWDPHPPLFLVVLHFWIKIFGFNEFSPRFFIALTGIISVFPVYFLGKELINKNTGIIAGFLLSVNYYHLYYSQEVRPYMLLFLFSTLSYLFFIRNLKRIGKSDRVFYVLSTVLLLYTHFFGLFVLISQLIYLGLHLIFQRKISRLPIIKDYLLSGFFMVLLYSPMIYFVLKMIEKKEHWIKSAPGSAIFPGIFAGFFGHETVLVALFAALLIILLFTCVKAQRGSPITDSKPDSLLFSVPVLFAWIFFSLFIPYFRSIMSVPMFSFKHAICVLAAVIILIAMALERIRPATFKGLIIASILILSLTSIFYHHDYYHKKTKQQWREAVSDIIRSVESKEKNIKTVVMSDEIRYSGCYFSLLKSNIEVKKPGFLNLKNSLRNCSEQSMLLIILDWDEQKIKDIRFKQIVSEYFTLIEQKEFISIKNLTYRADWETLEKLREVLKLT